MSDLAVPLLLPEPQPRAEKPSALPPKKGDKAMAWLVKPLRPLRAKAEGAKVGAILPALTALAPQMEAMETQSLIAEAKSAARSLRGAKDWSTAASDPLPRSMAAVRELLYRLSGRRLYDVQMLGAHAMLRGNIAQMATGEGKTLTAALCAAIAGLLGDPVHVITVNDYLTQRDHDIGAPLFGALGLTSGAIVEGMDLAQRQELYARAITYCTAKELAFDYLRDRMILGQADSALHLKLGALHAEAPSGLRMNGLHFAIVDEADSVLIDEARTPLVISGNVPGGITREEAEAALSLARSLAEGLDFHINRSEDAVRLLAPALEKVKLFAEGRAGNWRGRIRREEMLRQALSALHIFQAGEQYILQEGKIVIVSESTGRVMADRSWSGGLQQMVEAKEGCAELTPDRHNIAQITYQRLFRRYLRLGGLTGTTQGIRGELWDTYRLNVVDIPTHRPTRRQHLPDQIYKTDSERMQGVIARIRALHAQGIPVLLGTRSVRDCRLASAALKDAGLPHAMLSAEEDAAEAEIVHAAGEFGKINVVTAMAGRGTDISLGAGVEDLGGLHVIVLNRLEARRIEAQFAGRAGRQGQRGSYEMHLSLQDPILENALPALPKLVYHLPNALLGRAGSALLAHAQARLERRHAWMRLMLLETDREQSRILAFAGRGE